MNHLETLTAEWLEYNGYFVRSTVRVGKRARGGWDGELDVIAFHPARGHFLHVECSNDAHTWEKREQRFARKFDKGREHARGLFSGIGLPTASDLDQVVVHGFARAADRHRAIGGGRLITSQELTAEIFARLPNSMTEAIPEKYPLLRTLQVAKMAGANLEAPAVKLIPADEKA